VVLKERAVVAGLREAARLFRLAGASARPRVREGAWVPAGTPVLEVRGATRAILAAERTALNLLQRMSGIATETRRCADLARRANPGTRVAATRKTAPGLRPFDKRAVRLGGGWPHRAGLHDAILVKDNHIAAAGSLEAALRRALRARKPVEVEVSSAAEALRAARLGARTVMLDNVPPAEVARADRLLRGARLRKRLSVEASGGVTRSNLAAYARAGADTVSMGALTHSVRAVDLSLDLSTPRRRSAGKG
jgi:nicotinate-nucleotide pyrophosphorylase (carboxylating)